MNLFNLDEISLESVWSVDSEMRAAAGRQAVSTGDVLQASVWLALGYGIGDAARRVCEGRTTGDVTAAANPTTRYSLLYSYCQL